MKKLLTIVLVVVLVFAFTATAFAATKFRGDWSSTKCLEGFTTSQELQKETTQIWKSTVVYVTQLKWAQTPNYVQIQVTPRTRAGVAMGYTGFVGLGQHTTINILSDMNTYNYMPLRIGNPNKGNNMESKGYWLGNLK